MGKNKKCNVTSSSDSDDQQPAELQIAERFRNIDFCIHKISDIHERNLWNHGTERSARSLLEAMANCSRMLCECRTLAPSVRDEALKAKILSFLDTASEELGPETLFFAASSPFPKKKKYTKKDYARLESNVLRAMEDCRLLCERQFVRIAEELGAQAMHFPNKCNAGNSNHFIANHFQKSILRELNGKAFKKTQLIERLKCEPSRLYKPGGIKELRARGMVAHRHGVGYFRPDKPPPQED